RPSCRSERNWYAAPPSFDAVRRFRTDRPGSRRDPGRRPARRRCPSREPRTRSRGDVDPWQRLSYAMTFRTFWLKAHLYVGLTIGLVLFVVAVSGAALVFEDNIDRARHPALSYVTPGDHLLPLQELIMRVKAAYPAAQLGSVTFPEKPDHSMQVSARSKQDTLSIYINEYTGQVLGDREAAERETSLARRIHLLHTRLFAGQIGEWIVGVITFLTLFMATT